MKINLRIVNDFYAVIFIAYSFLFGGFLQYFIGVSNTITTFFFSCSFLAWYLLKSQGKIRKEYFGITIASLVIVLYIFLISIINGQGVIRPIIYSQFYFIPLALLLLFYSKDDQTFRYLKLKRIKKFLFFLALFQLPILLIQRDFFDFLIKFNASGQSLDFVDFQFGTFPLKNDHSLGFFLVVNLLYIWSYDVLKNKLQLIITSLVLIINLLLTNSNISILFAIFAIIFLILKKKNEIQIRISFKKVLITFIILIILFFALEYFEPKFYHDLKNKLSHKLELNDAIRWYKEGLARREQIVLIFLSEGVTFTGNGAYAYFDILSGQFNKTFRHFSQLIWSYYDLGLIGLTMFLLYVRSLGRLLAERRATYNLCLTVGLLAYSFFTIATFDLSLMLTYFIYKRKNND